MPETEIVRPAAEPDESDLSRSYAAVLIIEVVVIVALVWLGRHFG